MHTRRSSAMFAPALVATLLAASCGSTGSAFHAAGADDAGPGDDGGGGGGGGGGILGDGGSRASDGAAGKSCQTDGDCGPGGLCDPATHTCGCGGTQVTASDVPPNLLIVMDRSCSMTQSVAGTPKWTIAVQALSKLAQAYAGKIRFGLELFPERGAANKCDVTTIPIPVGPGNETKIEQLLQASLAATDPNYPSGPCVTPIDTAMTEAETDPGLQDKTRGDFTLLITDGQQAVCNPQTGDMVTVQAITTMANAGVHTFVVGFGSSVSVTALDSFAQAGGEVNAKGPHKFYDASDPASLDGALAAIAQQTLSCTLQLSSPPPNGDPNLVFVYFDKTPPPVPRDPTHTNGWDYDPATDTVTFYGTPCDELKTAQVKDAEVVYGCPGGAVPPPPK